MKLKVISPILIVACIYILIYFAFTSGLINAVLEGQNYNQAVFLPSRAVQNNYETFIGITVLLFGLVGAILTARAFIATKINEKYALLGAGFLILIISMIFMYKVMELKA
ncbi:MAG: hypothetical protein AB7U98_05130 [Candidatus Nitrosocosmicus sp.]|uniref:hypothetical protein n=1 Tax=Candidatus Nitrosocosmicus sp. FF01 TaxID=3397670 RepID=UPI002A714406|nr:hypothetical protein [Candidatus Nitrosocosmicus sp.]